MEQYTLDFRGLNGCPSQCHITIYREADIVVATNTDLGTSVTNACEIIAQEVVDQYGMNPKTMTFIERYYPGQPIETTDLVRFDFADGKAFRHPNWSHIPKEKFEKLVAKALALE